MKSPIKIFVLCLICLGFVKHAVAEDIKLGSLGKVYTISTRLNGLLTIEFLLDTGASDVSLPDSLTRKLLDSQIIAPDDFRGSSRYYIADGSSVVCKTFILRAVGVGTRVVRNVQASSCPGTGTPLLGQSFLKRLGVLTMDYARGVLVVESKPEEMAEQPTYTAEDVDWYRRAASQGDAFAQAILGFMYYQGKGLPKDYNKAFEWCQKAAAQGEATAQYNLGFMYYKGEGTPKDFKKAFEWYQKAAVQGLAVAQFGLGLMYYKGEGTPKDFKKAFEWYQKAAAQGIAVAQKNLGLMYYEGEGTPKNFDKALEWHQKAAEQGDAAAQYNLGFLYYDGKNFKKALEWYQKAAAQGHAVAQQSLGWMYYYGEGTPKNFDKALEWNQKAAAQGEATAQYRLGFLYYSGNGVHVDKVLALAWAYVAIAQGLPYDSPEDELAFNDEMKKDEAALSPAELVEAKKIAATWKQGRLLNRR